MLSTQHARHASTRHRVAPSAIPPASVHRQPAPVSVLMGAFCRAAQARGNPAAEVSCESASQVASLPLYIGMRFSPPPAKALQACIQGIESCDY